MNVRSANGGQTNKAEDAGAEARTVFVRNLPFTLTDSQLQEVFSEVGPVRRSFTIKENGSEQHRGFGYVQFAIVDDALRAVKEKDGTVLEGRKVMVKLAKRRPPLEQRLTKRQPDNSDKRPNKDKHESLSSPGLDGKAPQTLLNVSAEPEKQRESIQAKSNRRGEAAQGKQTSQHGSRAMQETCNSSGATLAKERKSLSEMDNGDAVHAKNKRKRQHDTSEPGGMKKKKKMEKSDTCQTSLKNDVVEEKRSSETQRVARTVILGGLLSPEMREAVIERAKKVGSVESIQSSLSPQELKGRGLEKDGCKAGAAAVVFKSVKSASQAVAELHHKSVDNGIVWARQLGGEGSKPKKSRVIIRNLPFNITEEKIRELFSSSGFVWEAKVPRKEDGRARGFAFVSFTSKANAEKAIQNMNGKVVQKRPIAVDWAVQKEAYQPSTSVHIDDKEKLPSDIEEDETASEDDDEVFAKQENSSFEEFEDERAENELLAGSVEMDLAKRVLNKVVSASISCTKPENVEPKQIEGDGRGSLSSAEELKGSQSERKTAAHEDQSIQRTSLGDIMKTIFVKNLPLDVDQATLKRLFSAFGKVKSTYLVRHPETKRPKGTAFLEFLNAESAEAAVGAASGSSLNNQFVSGISLAGRKLEVLKALEKKSAAALEKEKLEKNVTDRRNLYLLKEGKIEVGSPAAIGVSEQDMQKRQELEQVKKVKLKSPKFHVSKTRLAIHNLPKSLKEAELRKFFIEAVKLRATKQQPVITEVIILRDEAKGGESRGIAFVEYTEHEHALVALRVLNNNPETFGPDRRPIVEFAIENLQRLRKRQERQSAAGKQGMADSEGNAQFRKLKGGGKKRNSRQSQKNESRLLEMEEEGLNGKEHGGLDSGVGKAARGKLKKKVKPNEQHMADSSFKRKWQDTSSNQENTIKALSMPNFKRQKLFTKGNDKGSDLERSKRSKPFSGSNSAAKGHANESKLKMDKAELVLKARDSNLGIYGQQRKPKEAKEKKGSKLEVQDKLDKLVAAYREKYFSDKGKKKATGATTASSDFKRWFE
ncbi:hypothetical protein GOP47_0001334 [Adiantum capillus-veneris]|uniref:RRM domain-containing protein n=1 Tax=Adiantum capillus-veneris TaxID=13818 RepID=A0A9D4V9B2_ADICA|nr:hypothetical protein GOP47_0001334 [Adiantum capillus-veneris]